MALETLFQVSTIFSYAAASPATTKLSYFQTEKLNVISRKSKCSLSSSSSSAFNTSRLMNGRTARIVCEAKNAVDGVQAVTDENWENLVIGSDIPVVVDFWAPWCGPCRMIAPIIDELAKEYAGKVSCYKVNTDESPNIASKYGIRSIPTVLFFKNGEKKDSIIGAVPKETLTNAIEKYI